MSDERRPDEPEVPEEEAAGSVGDAVAESDGSVEGGQDPAGLTDPVGSQDPDDSPEIAPADFDAGPGATVPIVPRQLPTAASFFGEPRAPRHSAHVEPGPPSSGPVAPEVAVPEVPAPEVPVVPEAVAPVPATPAAPATPVAPATPASANEVAAAPGTPPEPEAIPAGTAFAQPAWPSESEQATPPPAAPHPMALDLSALRGQHDDSDDAVEPPTPWSLTAEQPSLDATAFPAHDGEGEVPTAAFGAVFGSTPTAPVQHIQPESSFTELISMPADAVPDTSEPASFNWSDLPAPAAEPPATQAFHFEDAHAVPPVVVPPANLPSSEAVVNEQPIPEEPRAEEPRAEEPPVEEPQTEEPPVEEPLAEASQVEEPRAEEPDAATAMFPAQAPAGTANEPQDPAAEPDAEPVAEPTDPAVANAEAPPTPAPWWLGERLAEAAAERKSAAGEPEPQDAPTTDEPPTFTELLGVVPAEPTNGDESKAEAESSAAESATAGSTPEPAPGAPWSLTSDIEPQVPLTPSGETPGATGAAAAGPDDDLVAPPIEPFWRQPAADETLAEPAVPAPAAPTSEPDPDVDPVAALFGEIVEPTEPGEIVEEHRLAGSEWPAVEVDSDWADVPRDPALESDAGGADLPPTEAFTLPEADEADVAAEAPAAEPDVDDASTRAFVVPPVEETPTQAMPEAESAWAAAAAAAAAEAAAQEARASQAAAARQAAHEQAARAEAARVQAERAEAARAEAVRAEAVRAEAARAEAERAATERIAAAPTPPPVSAPGAPTPSGVGASRRPVTPIDPTKVPASWTTAAPTAAPPRTSGTGGGGGFSSWPRQRKILLFVGIIVAFVVVLLALFFFSYSIASNAASAPAQAPVATASQQTSAAPKPTPTTTPSPTSSTGTVSAGVHQWSDLRGGECLSSFTNAWQQTYTVVSCNNAHAGQLIATGSVAGAAGSAYPGLSALQAQVAPKCQANTVLNISAAQAYTGVQVSASYPATAAEWAAGSRTYFCFVSRTGGQTFTSSLAAAS